jgi:hypothetical protein
MSADPTNDTHPKIEALLIEGYRKMSPSQKLEVAPTRLHGDREACLLSA